MGGPGGLGSWSVRCLRGAGPRTCSPVCFQVQVWGFAIFPCWLRGLLGPAAFPLPAQHGSRAVGGLGGQRDAGSLSTESTGMGMGVAVGKGEGCPSHPSKSVLGVSKSKMLPSFVPARLWGWRALLGSRPHRRASPRGQASSWQRGAGRLQRGCTGYREGKASPKAGDSLWRAGGG